MLRAFLALAFLAWASVAHAQSEDLIRREIDQALARGVWELGPLHLTPQMRAGVAYDSNALLTSDSPNPDVTAVAAPGILVVVPLRSRALVEFYEELGFVYYRDLVELRDIFNVTRAGGAFGGKSLVMRVEDEFREGKVRPSRELDVPVDQRSNLLSASLSQSLGWRHELSFEYEKYRVRIRDSELTVGGVPIKSLLDRTVDTYGLSLTRHLSTETATFFQAFYETADFDDDSVQRDAKGYGGVAGFVFSPTGKVRGEAQLGYKWIIPVAATQPDFAGVIGTAGIGVGLGQRFAMEVLWLRDTEPSLLSENLFVVVSQYGAFLDVYLGRRFFVRPGVVLGGNGYPGVDTSQGEQVQELLIRDFNIYSLSFNYHLTPTWLVRLGGRYSTYELSSPSSVENRFIVSLGLTTVF